MKKAFFGIILAGIGLMMSFGASAAPVVIYDALPSPTPGNVPSLGYQATSTTQFGDKITFAGTARELSSVTVLMSNWAKQSDNTGFGTALGYNTNLTFSIYNVGVGDAVGSLIATSIVNALVPWRPETSAGCSTGWMDNTGNCFNGKAFEVDFAFSGILPDSVIYGLSFNTQSYGNQPTGVNGPYNSLNFGLSNVLPLIGTDTEVGSMYWNTSFAGFYADLGAGGVGTFRKDTAWSPYSGAIRFVADDGLHVPEPGSMALMGAALGGLFLVRRKTIGKSLGMKT